VPSPAAAIIRAMPPPDDLPAHVEHEMAVARVLFRSRIAKLAVASVVLDLVAAAIALESEEGARHAFGSYLDALFWTTTQLLTVSSQLANPEHAVTKVLDVVLEAWAIIVVASLAATFSDLLHHRTRHRAMQERQRPAASPGADVR
jgi:hypothetical protein